jgi:hypothetical protein
MADPDEDYVPAVPYVPFRCPSCGKHKPRTYSVRANAGQRTVRYHRCLSCGVKYRSFELTAQTMRLWTQIAPA